MAVGYGAHVVAVLSVLGFASACSPALHVLDADLARGYPQTRPVPPQAYVLNPTTATATPMPTRLREPAQSWALRRPTTESNPLGGVEGTEANATHAVEFVMVIEIPQREDEPTRVRFEESP